MNKVKDEQLKYLKHQLEQSNSGIRQDIKQLNLTPLALTDDKGLPYKSNKACVVEYYSAWYKAPSVTMQELPTGWTPEIVFIEGMNFIHNCPNRIIHKTFEDYADHIIQENLLPHLHLITTKAVYIIFDSVTDSYITPKQIEQQRRDITSQYSPTICVSRTASLPSNWAAFLKNRPNKVSLVSFFWQLLIAQHIKISETKSACAHCRTIQ